MGTEYRLDELARQAEVASTTVRLYQAKGLLAPPRLEGRTGWYDDSHLSRLRLIARLQSEGYSLAGIANLLEQWEQGRSLDAVIGVEAELDALLGEVHAVVLDPAELLDRFPDGSMTPEVMQRAASLGLVQPTDDGKSASPTAGSSRPARPWPPRHPARRDPRRVGGARRPHRRHRRAVHRLFRDPPRAGRLASGPRHRRGARARATRSPSSRPPPGRSSPPRSTPASPASVASASASWSRREASAASARRRRPDLRRVPDPGVRSTACGTPPRTPTSTSAGTSASAASPTSPRVDGEPQRFTYATTVAPGVTIAGTGESLGDRDRPDGTRWSGLRFWAADRRSIIDAGAGYWRYVPTDDGVRFLTRYDYRPRWGRFGELLDRTLFRPLFGWATAWSFDRLRLWLEDGTPPERTRTRPSPTRPRSPASPACSPTRAWCPSSGRSTAARSRSGRASACHRPRPAGRPSGRRRRGRVRGRDRRPLATSDGRSSSRSPRCRRSPSVPPRPTARS